MVDANALGAFVKWRAGSSPVIGTKKVDCALATSQSKPVSQVDWSPITLVRWEGGLGVRHVTPLGHARGRLCVLGAKRSGIHQ